MRFCCIDLRTPGRRKFWVYSTAFWKYTEWTDERYGWTEPARLLRRTCTGGYYSYHQYRNWSPAATEILDGIYWGGIFSCHQPVARSMGKTKYVFLEGLLRLRGNGQWILQKIVAYCWLPQTCFFKDVDELWKDALSRHLGGCSLMANFRLILAGQCAAETIDMHWKPGIAWPRNPGFQICWIILSWSGLSQAFKLSYNWLLQCEFNTGISANELLIHPAYYGAYNCKKTVDIKSTWWNRDN